MIPQRSPLVIGGYTVDVVSSESHEYGCEVSQFPVEKGADISDNIRPLPRRLSLSGIVSRSPIGKVASLRSATEDPAMAFRDAMERVIASRETFAIETSAGLMTSMALVSFSHPEIDGALFFDGTFQRVEVRENRQTSVRVAEPRAQKRKALGASPKKPPPAAPAPREYTTKSASDWLASAVDSGQVAR